VQTGNQRHLVLLANTRIKKFSTVILRDFKFSNYDFQMIKIGIQISILEYI